MWTHHLVSTLVTFKIPGNLNCWAKVTLLNAKEHGKAIVENGWLSCRNLADSGRFLQDDASSAGIYCQFLTRQPFFCQNPTKYFFFVIFLQNYYFLSKLIWSHFFCYIPVKFWLAKLLKLVFVWENSYLIFFVPLI